jgi:hypothetical protein
VSLRPVASARADVPRMRRRDNVADPKADSSTSEGSNASKTPADGQGRLRYAHGEPPV